MESDRAEQRIVKLNGENDQLLAASALLLKVFQCAVGTHVATVQARYCNSASSGLYLA